MGLEPLQDTLPSSGVVLLWSPGNQKSVAIKKLLETLAGGGYVGVKTIDVFLHCDISTDIPQCILDSPDAGSVNLCNIPVLLRPPHKPLLGAELDTVEDIEGLRMLIDAQVEGEDAVRSMIQKAYGMTAAGGNKTGGQSVGCCGGGDRDYAQISSMLGYSEKDLEESGNLGLGCGNPRTFANLKPGEVVLDLGAGGGFDCFLAAKEVGAEGQVIGVDMTPEMVHKARAAKREHDVKNVDFRLGEIENLPCANGQVDCIISNCVVNLSTNKKRVFSEAYRVLKPGGRVAITDIIRRRPEELPEKLRTNEAYAC